MLVIEARGLTKSFGSIHALRDVTFSIPRGRVAGFLGPNGAGKTTTLKILVGLLRRDGGEVRVFGLDPWEQGVEVREKMGVLHERPLYPKGARVSTILRYTARLKGYDYGEALRMAKIAGIDRFLSYPVSSLSRGFLQRLGIALALLGDPELLLLDEPTANLDPLTRMSLLAFLGVLHRELGLTILISSHILPELSMVCDYAVFIAYGATLDWGSLEELNRKYGIVSVYEFATEEPRELARDLIMRSYVIGVEVADKRVKVKIDGSYATEFLDELRERGITRVRHVGGELGQLYSRVMSSRDTLRSLEVVQGGGA